MQSVKYELQKIPGNAFRQVSWGAASEPSFCRSSLAFLPFMMSVSSNPASNTLRGQAIQGVKWFAIARLCARVIQFFTTVALVRLLQPSQFGVFSMALIVLNFLQEFNDGGMATAILRDNTISKRVLDALFWLNIAFGFILAGITYAVARPVSLAYSQPDLIYLLRWLSVTLIISSPGDFVFWVLRRDLRYKAIMLIELISSLTWMVGSITAAWLGAGAAALVYGYLLRTTLRTCVYTAYSASQRTLPQFPPHFAALRGETFLLRFSFFQVLDNATYYLACNVDFAIIGWMLGAVQLAYYTVGYNLVIGLIRVVNPTLQNVALPILGQVKENKKSLLKGYYQLIRLLAMIVVPLLTACALCAYPLVRTLYGVRWTASAVVIEYLCLYGVFYSYRSVTIDMLKVKGRADISFFYNLGTLVLMLVADWVGARTYGIVGVAAAAVLVSILLMYVDYRLGVKQYGLSLRSLYWAVRPALKGAFAMALILWTLMRGLPAGSFFAFIYIGIAISSGALVVWIFERDCALEFIEIIRNLREKRKQATV